MIQISLTKLNRTILYYVLFYKNFYKFMFLHKPLCPRYKNNTIKIFGIYICKSCLLLYSGFVLTLCLLIPKVKSVYFDKYFLLFCFGLLLTLMASYPSIYSNFRPITKNFVRLYDGIFLAGIFFICFKINIYAGIMSILGFIFLKNIYNKKRKSRNLCKNCEQLQEGKTCIGYKEQKEALLKIDEEYSNIIMKQQLKKKGL